MSRALSSSLLTQLFGQNSNDPFLALLTLDHESFDAIRLVNNTESVTSNSLLYSPFNFKITLPVDDGESIREIKLTVDNVTTELIEDLRSVTTPINVNLKMILASNPDFVEIEYNELKLRNIAIVNQTISGSVILDDFLNTGMTSEQYTPTNFPGIFG